MNPVLATVSAIESARWKSVPNSSRILVTVYFDGPLPPIIGFWTLN